MLLLTIGGQFEDRLDIRECALPSLRQLLEATGTTSFLCVRRDTRAVCVERLDGQAVRSLAMQLGSSLPLFAGAAPRAIFAFLPPAEQRSSLKASRLPGDPPRPDATAIQADIERVRRDGFAVSDGDVTPGIAALGAPVFNHRGELEAAISISGLRSQILGSSRKANIELITSCAREVSRISWAAGDDVSVERPMVILQRSADLVTLLAERGAMVPAEIAEYVDTPRSSVYRLGDALRDAAMIEQSPDAHLRLGLRWLRLADAARAAMS